MDIITMHSVCSSHLLEKRRKIFENFACLVYLAPSVSPHGVGTINSQFRYYQTIHIFHIKNCNDRPCSFQDEVKNVKLLKHAA